MQIIFALPMESEHVEALIFYNNKLGELAFEAYYFIFPISFVLNQRDRYPLDIIGNANENPELLEETFRFTQMFLDMLQTKY